MKPRYFPPSAIYPDTQGKAEELASFTRTVINMNSFTGWPVAVKNILKRPLTVSKESFFTDRAVTKLDYA